MSSLNKDVLFLLFEDLQDDSKSLFSCLMVNRFWCETGIPVLWRNPWRYSIDYSNKSFLYYIFTLYLPDDVKESLTRQGIQLPPISCQSPLFDYLSFCKSIDVKIMSSIISIGSSSDYTRFLLQQEIYRILIKKLPEVKYLDMKSMKHQIFYFPEARLRLDSLCELKCDTSIDSSYFYGLSCICQYIQRLVITNIYPENNDGIAKLIEVQKNLKYFEWVDTFNDYYFINTYEVIFLALVKNTDTLNHLTIAFRFGVDYYNHVFLQKALPKLHKLKTLKISNLYLSGEEQLKVLEYRDLKILKMDCIDIHTAACMIKNSGGYLREISLNYNDLYLYEEDFNKDSLIFINAIYENCPLIEYLSLVISSTKENFIEFEKLLNVCQKLKSLFLISSNVNNKNVIKSNEEKFADGKELLEVLIRSEPTNLKEVKFFDNFKFSLETLEAFLTNWRGRQAISIFSVDPIYDEENYVKLINKYKNDGVIKDFSKNIYSL